MMAFRLAGQEKRDPTTKGSNACMKDGLSTWQDQPSVQDNVENALRLSRCSMT